MEQLRTREKNGHGRASQFAFISTSVSLAVCLFRILKQMLQTGQLIDSRGSPTAFYRIRSKTKTREEYVSDKSFISGS